MSVVLIVEDEESYRDALGFMLESARQRNHDDSVAAALADVQTCTRDLDMMFNDLLDLSRLEGGTLELRMQPVPLSMVLLDARRMFAPVAEQQGVALRVLLPREVDAAIGRDPRNRLRMAVVDLARHPGKAAQTRVEWLRNAESGCLLRCLLRTGRTHQIRAHMASIGHPLAGDGKYGKNVQNKKTGFPYQALYSYKLIFRFTTEAGMLSYLDGREFTAQDVWFLDEFRAFPK